MLFFILFLSFFLRVIRKGLRKNSEIFVNLGGPRGSLCVSGLTADHYFWCSRVFLAVLTVFRGIMGCSGVLWDVPGVVRGCSGLFRGCSGDVPGCSGGVPGCSRVFRGCSWFYRHPFDAVNSDYFSQRRQLPAQILAKGLHFPVLRKMSIIVLH